MVAPRKVLILGGGTAGITLANKLRILNKPSELDIEIIGKDLKHFCRADSTMISLGFKDYRNSVKNVEFLLNNDITFTKDSVESIHPNSRVVMTESGKQHSYDVLVIATGAVLHEELIPGFSDESKHFYDLQHSIELYKNLEDFNEGKVVIGIPELPVQCPIANHEFALMLHELLKAKGVREKCEIHFIYPDDNLFPDENISQMFMRMFDDAGIIYHKGFKLKEIIQKNKEIVSESGEKINYKLLVLAPPHRGQDFIMKSNLGDEKGFIKVDKETLLVDGFEDVYALGDATNLPVPKTASAVIHSAKYLARRVTSQVKNLNFYGKYEGDVSCSIAVGMNSGITLSFSYSKKPRVPIRSSADFNYKMYFSDTYFSTFLRGLM